MTWIKLNKNIIKRDLGKLIIIAIILNLGFFGSLFLIKPREWRTSWIWSQELVFGTNADPIDMDPHMCYDTAGGDIISQICECLYKFDVTDPAYPLIPVLATALPTVTGGGTELTIPLRQGVTFHDGSAFNATVAKWNFDRLNYYMNISGNKYLEAPFNVPLAPTQTVAKHAALFTISGMTIINKTEIVNNYEIKIVMNLPKASFINFLCYEATSIQSMISARSQGKQFQTLEYADGDHLSGTGPFIFQNYFTDIQVKFTRNDDYWARASYLTNVTFWIIEDDIALNTAVLAGDIDLYDAPKAEFLNQFRNDPDITLLEAGSTLNINYMGFNGEMVPTAYRKAISYAINYSYIIDYNLLGEAYRLKSPIPTGISMSNYGFNYPTFDRAYAQSLMQALGHGTTFTTDLEWYTQGLGAGWGFGWNITAQSEGITRRDIALYISDNLKYMGINAPVVQIPFQDIVSCMKNNTGPLRRDKIPMYMFGWFPDYLDPENYITPLYSNTSAIWVNTWDHELEQWMLAGETTPDPVARQVIYNNIQQKLVEELYFFVWLTSGKNYDVYLNYVHGWVPNAIARVDFYTVYLC